MTLESANGVSQWSQPMEFVQFPPLQVVLITCHHTHKNPSYDFCSTDKAYRFSTHDAVNITLTHNMKLFSPSEM